MRNWILPEYIEDVLPKEAARVETLRRNLLDLFHVHGYQFVIPPMMEYLESLITGVGHDLDLATFKVVDQLTGRLMGVRADTTPQAARIDAHMLNNAGVTRLCYAGTVLRTNPDGLAQTREPFQVGAELFGHAGVESDIEIHRLMIKALQKVGITSLHIDFSHVGIFADLVKSARLDSGVEEALYTALQSKDQASVRQLTISVEPHIQQALCSLTRLSGGVEILDSALTVLPQTPAISKALADLRQIHARLADLDVDVCFDLSELRGYHYHSGVVFAAYAQGYAGPLALGGRYDEVGKAFGRARPATGFSLDLRGLLSALPDESLKQGIFAPIDGGKTLQAAIEKLRANGEVVLQALPGQEAYTKELNCNRKLILENGVWSVVPAPELVN